MITGKEGEIKQIWKKERNRQKERGGKEGKKECRNQRKKNGRKAGTDQKVSNYVRQEMWDQG